jgi:Family of unknown function (DUF6526)
MSEKRPQTFANHARADPWFHFLIVPVLSICFGFAIYAEIHRPGVQHVWFAALSLAVLMLAFISRAYALKVQDRVIRLEERLRLSALLPQPLRSRIPELTEAQLIALRFAADDEVPSLVEKILRESLDPKQIKKAINNWRPDYWRV